jgi:asparagine synthase (glutamine-hydrolysing)
LPKEIIYQKKSGFAVPIKSWFKDLEPLIKEALNPGQIRKDGYFNPEAVEKMILDTLQNKKDYSYQIWALLMFKLWKENFIEKSC